MGRKWEAINQLGIAKLLDSMPLPETEWFLLQAAVNRNAVTVKTRFTQLSVIWLGFESKILRF